MSLISTRQKVGLVLAAVMSIINIPSVFFPAPDGDEGPPLAVLAVNSVLGIIGLVAVVIAWRSGSRAAIRVAAGTLILNAITALPAFFVDVPAGLKVAVGATVLVTLLAVVLMFSPARRSAPVLD
jgi:hypothetical protein